MNEHDEARVLANKILDRVKADPDDDLAVLARQLLRADEKIGKMESANATARLDTLVEIQQKLAARFPPSAPGEVDGIVYNGQMYPSAHILAFIRGLVKGPTKRAAEILKDKPGEVAPENIAFFDELHAAFSYQQECPVCFSRNIREDDHSITCLDCQDTYNKKIVHTAK